MRLCVNGADFQTLELSTTLERCLQRMLIQHSPEPEAVAMIFAVSVLFEGREQDDTQP